MNSFALTPPDNLTLCTQSSSAPLYQEADSSGQNVDAQPVCVHTQGQSDPITLLQKLKRDQLASTTDGATASIWQLSSDQPLESPVRSLKGTQKVTALGEFAGSLVTGTAQGIVNLWNPLNGTCQKTMQFAAQVEITSIATCGVGKIAVGNVNNRVSIWDFTVQKEGPSLVEHKDRVTGLKRLLANTFVSVSADRTIIIWDCVKGERVRGIYRQHESPILSLAVLDDLLITGDAAGSIVYSNIRSAAASSKTEVAGAANCMDSTEHLVAIGTEEGKIVFQDTRSESDGPQDIELETPVKAVSFVNSTSIAVGSDCLSLWDLRYNGASEGSFDVTE